jgi:F-type H+-transporting ATPase subunit epsilon
MGMEVYLVTPEREVWSGEASLVVARGSEGELGVMAGHAPLLIELGIGPLFIQTDQERLAAAVDGGFLHVMSSGDESRVDILAEHAELAHEIDLEAARSRIEEARRRVSEETTDEGKAEAHAELARAETRVNLQERA